MSLFPSQDTSENEHHDADKDGESSEGGPSTVRTLLHFLEGFLQVFRLLVGGRSRGQALMQTHLGDETSNPQTGDRDRTRGGFEKTIGTSLLVTLAWGIE